MMADTDISREEEARNLAKEALEAKQQGDREESGFLADAAKALDKDAAAEILSGKDDAKS